MTIDVWTSATGLAFRSDGYLLKRGDSCRVTHVCHRVEHQGRLYCHSHRGNGMAIRDPKLIRATTRGTRNVLDVLNYRLLQIVWIS